MRRARAADDGFGSHAAAAAALLAERKNESRTRRPTRRNLPAPRLELGTVEETQATATKLIKFLSALQAAAKKQPSTSSLLPLL